MAHKRKTILTLLEDAADLRQRAEKHFNNCIVLARDEGFTLRDLEEVAGITNPAIFHREKKTRSNIHNVASKDNH